MSDERERLAALEREVTSIKEMLVRMEGKMDAWSQNYVPRAETNEMLRTRDTQIDHCIGRITALEANQTWLWRTFAAAVITTIVSVFWITNH